MWQQEKSNCAKLWGHIFQFDCHVCVANKNHIGSISTLQAHIFFLSLEVRNWCKCWLQQAMVIGWLWRGKGSPWPLYYSVSSGPILLIWTWTPQITMVRQQTRSFSPSSKNIVRKDGFAPCCLWGPLGLCPVINSNGKVVQFTKFLFLGSCLKFVKLRLNPGIVGATPLSGTPRCFPGYGWNVFCQPTSR